MKKRNLKLISWNVNGLRAVFKKDFQDSFQKLNADIFAIQETKLQEPQVTDAMRNMEGHEAHFSFSTVKKGYSGVGTYSKIAPRRVNHGIGISAYDDEGRILEFDYDDFLFYNIYFPNGQMNEERLNYKLAFYNDFFAHLDAQKQKGRSIIIAGDFNTAHNEIDLKNPKPNAKRSGFLRIERDWLDRIIENGYVDTFRHLHPETVQYSWWSYRFQAREKNAGWRIDYFFVSEDIIQKGWVKNAFIDNSIFGSDHCPIGLEIEF